MVNINRDDNTLVLSISEFIININSERKSEFLTREKNVKEK